MTTGAGGIAAGKGQLVGVPHLFQHEDNHTDGNKKLQHRGDEEARADQMARRLEKRKPREVSAPE